MTYHELEKQKKKDKPLAKELKEIKQAIRDFKENREYLDYEIKVITQKYKEKMAEYEKEGWLDWKAKEMFNSRMNQEIYDKCDYYGLDAMIQIIYKDGTELIASGTEIVTGEITPKMQHIVYASYSDGWVEYDTFTGILFDDNVSVFGDLSTDDGIIAKETYYNMIENKFKNRLEEK